MALTTFTFCVSCKKHSSIGPIDHAVAGSPCPECGSCLSALHADPEYVGVDQFGRPYSEATVIAEILATHGIPW